MAWEGVQIKVPGLVAAANLTALQYTFVKLDANGKVIAASAQGEACIGVLQNKPNTGEAAEVVIFGISKVVADAAINEMDQLTNQTDGQAMAAASADFVLGTAITAAGGAGEVITAAINCVGIVVL